MDQRESSGSTYEDELHGRIRAALLEFFKEGNRKAEAAQKRFQAWLHLSLVECFSAEDLHTLCFKLGVDYEILPGAEKSSKAREIVAYFERNNRIDELVEVCQQLRPKREWPDISEWSHLKFDPALHEVFEDHRLELWRDRLPDAYNPADRVDAIRGYLRYQFNDDNENALVLLLYVLADHTDPENALHRRLINSANELARIAPRADNSSVGNLRSLSQQLKDWKEAHNLLHNLYKHLDLLRPYIRQLNQLRHITELHTPEEETLFEFENRWRAYRGDLSVLLEFAEGIQIAGEGFRPSPNLGRNWFVPLREGSDAINESIFNSNFRTLGDELSDFCDRVSVSFYLVDKALYEVASQIQGATSNRL